MTRAKNYRNFSFSVAGHAALLTAGLLFVSSPPLVEGGVDGVQVDLVSDSAISEVPKGAPDQDKIQPLTAPEQSPAPKPASRPPVEDARAEPLLPPPPLRPDLKPSDQPDHQPEPVKEAARESSPPPPEPVEANPDPKPAQRPADLAEKAEEPDDKAEKDAAEPVEPPKPVARPEAVKPAPPKEKPQPATEAKPKPEIKPKDIQALLEAKARQNLAKNEKPRSARDAPKTDGDFDARAINKIIGAPTQTASAPNLGQRVASLGVTQGSGARMAPNVVSAFSNWLGMALRPCWHYYGTDTEYKPEIEIKLRPDGSLDAAPRLLNPPRQAGAASKGEAAVRAARECSPLRVPARFQSYYEQWKKWTVQFDPD